MYCVNENKDAKAHFAFFFNFSFCHSGHFLSVFSATTWFRIMNFLCTLSGRQSVLCKWKLKCQSSFCLLFSNFQFFLLSLSYNTYGHFSSKFSQKLLDLGLWSHWQFCLFSESVATSDGYRWGYVSFAHFLLYLIGYYLSCFSVEILNLI